MKIAIVSYYGLRECLSAAKTALEGHGFEVIDYPLLERWYSEFKVENPLQDLISFLKTESLEYLLWWCLSIDSKDLIQIRQEFPEVSFMLFNWDDPYNFEPCHLKDKVACFDVAYISSVGNLTKYLDHGCKKSVYCLPGFDPKVFKPLDIPYVADVTFVATNLYADSDIFPGQIFNRKQYIDNVYAAQKQYKYVFHIHGPEFLKELYPESYQGYCRYENLNTVFNSSRININTHGVGNCRGYRNERAIILIGSGCLVLTDNVPGLDLHLQPGVDCRIIDPTNPGLQIRSILDSPTENVQIQSNFRSKRHKYTWDTWAQTLIRGLPSTE